MMFGGLVGGLLIGGLAGSAAVAIVAAALLRRVKRLETRARAAERLAELGTLTGGLAHEIKNPLSTVNLNLQLLKEDFPIGDSSYPRLVNRLAVVQRETSRLREILDDFMRYAGRIELDLRPTDLNVLLEDLVDFFAPQAAAQRVQLRLRQHAGGPLVARIDERLIKQTILNLMINATQAMDGRGGELILAAGQSADAEATIDVIDTGSGIAPDALDRIFDAYYSTKPGGTGLGLAIARRIVREHGGELAATSEVGKGTDFKLTLPRATI